jgi:hypothetical protein
MKLINKIILATTIGAVFAGCAVPELNKGGVKARVLEIGDVSSCRELGKTSASVLDKILGIDRSMTTMKEELETISRNTAANMGGDTIVPLTKIVNGKQSFLVYKCVDPEN